MGKFKDRLLHGTPAGAGQPGSGPRTLMPPGMSATSGHFYDSPLTGAHGVVGAQPQQANHVVNPQQFQGTPFDTEAT